MTEQKRENKNRNVAWAVSIGLHALLLLIFIFMIAWREPNPPYPEYGIEVNFGTSTVGSGEQQPTEPVNNSQSEEEAQPEEVQAEEQADEIIEEVQEVVEETVSVQQESEVITQPSESPDVIEEKVEEEVKKPVEKQPEEKKEETPVKEEPVEAKAPVTYQNKDGAQGETGESATPKNANQGDDVNATGDKGNPEGDLDSRTLYGNKGGGGGAPALKISGWFWDEIPDKKDASSENGMVEFSFVVDEEGYVGNIQVIKSTVSPAVANFYKEQLRNTTFSQTNPNVAPLPQTKGTVTFIIKSK